MPIRCCMAWMLALAALAGAASAADAQGPASARSYPVKPIRIVTTSFGGGVDFAARLIALGLSANLGQQVIVDNRGDHVTTDIVSKAPPDGYTLLVTGSGFVIEPLFRSASYDPLKDFAPVTLAVTSPSMLVVHPALEARSVAELIGLAKAKPGSLNYGSAGAGGAAHLAAELFRGMAGINIVHVPYKGSGPALTDLIGGRLQLMFAAMAAAPAHVSAGRLRALGITSAQPSALAPGVPAIAATVPGYEAVAFVGVYAPAKTPQALAQRLSAEIGRALSRDGIRDKLLSTGAEAASTTPEGLAARIKSETAKWGKLIKDLGLRAE